VQAQRTLREQVAQQVRAAIVTGRLRGGTVHSVPNLAKQFAVSPTPVREAILDLAKEGLVEMVKNKGFRVVELSDVELDEITQVRMLLEIPAVVAQVGGLAPETLTQLRELGERIVTAAQEADLIGYLNADTDFHTALLGGFGNRLLASTVIDLRHRSRLYGLEELTHTGKLADSAAEHLELVDLLERGTAAQVEQLMRRHLSHIRELRA
jgi:DNA-binding GntR family transcriptional regulator